MDLYLAGGLHDDPLCRDQLVGWTHSLVDSIGDPTFVAVEMDVGIKGILDGKRQMFRVLAGGLFGGGAAPQVIEALAMTMAWEVDSHRALLKDLDPIYLDLPDKPRSHAINGVASFEHFNIELKDYAGDPTSVSDACKHLSQKAAARATDVAKAYASKRDEQKARERDFMYSLRFALKGNGWGLIVVGALHASNYDGDTLRALLQKAGHKVTVKYLTWQPPAGIA